MSGNGNIGLIPIGILFIVLIYLFKKIYQAIPKSFSPFYILAFLLISTILVFLSIYYGNKRLNFIKKSLLENFELNDVYQLTNGITYYTNTVFINFFSICTLISLAALILMLVKKYINKQLKNWLIVFLFFLKENICGTELLASKNSLDSEENDKR